MRIRPNGQLANSLRNMGLSRAVDSPKVRSLLGLPIHAEAQIQKKVSVIVPAYNVAAYLEDAVGTVLAQSHTNLEIVIVNDGSADETGAIADRIARGDRRVKVIHKKNAGLGAARNTGLKATSGEYVTFVDSDDQLTPRAIETLLRSLEQTGSDFAIGAVERFNSTRVWTPEWVNEVHDVPRERIKADEHPPVLWDVFVWNKLFRRRVWDERVGLFPEGVLYEDQECTARLYVEGATFDSLTETVYRWRFRDDGSSITQNKHSTEDLQDRLLVARTVRGVLRSGAQQGLLDTWYSKLLGDDLYWYYREVPRAEEGFWELLVEAVQEFFAEASKEAVLAVPFDRRLHLLAIALGTKHDFETVLMHFQEHGPGWTTRLTVGSQLVGHVEPVEALSATLPLELLAVTLPQESATIQLLRSEYHRDGAISFDGFVHAPNFAIPEGSVFRANLVSADGGEVSIPIGIQQLRLPDANVRTRDSRNDLSWGGFKLTLPAELLSGRCQFEKNETIGKLTLEVETELGYVVAMRTKRQMSGDLARLGAGMPTQSSVRFQLEEVDGDFWVSASAVQFPVKRASLTARTLEIEFSAQGHEGRDELELYLRRGEPDMVTGTAIRSEGSTWLAEIDLPANRSAIKSNYRGTPIEVGIEDEPLGALETDSRMARMTSTANYGLYANKSGQLQVERYVQFGEVRSIDLSEDGRELSVSGIVRLSRQQVRQATPSLMLWHRDQTIFPKTITYEEESGGFVASFSLRTQDVDGRETSFLSGTYLMGMLLAQKTGLPPTFTLVPSEPLSKDFPKTVRAGNSRVTLQRRARDGGLEVVLAAPFAERERGHFSQSGLSRGYQAKASQPNLVPAVLFESFGGRSIGDSPKAIDAVLADTRQDLKRLWTVRDHTVAVPAGATPIVRYSAEWYDALASSRYLVNNNNFPPFFRKAKGQTYIQTWHGTPLKRIGNDVPPESLSLVYRALMNREVELWDVLLAQSPWAGEKLSGAFGYTGEVFNEGYPRNDVLVDSSAHLRRSQVRRYFGIGNGQRVVLYAPTWRDNLKDSSGRYLSPALLDPQEVYKELGHDTVLLVRGHSNTAGVSAKVTGASCIDVSTYPDVNDLMLAADVLVTDYSSIQFDFVNTRRPIILLAPDLEQYRDSVRGFYLNYEAVAPGPIVSNTGEVVELLKSQEHFNCESEARYMSFRERFAPNDDGTSAQRFVERYFS